MITIHRRFSLAHPDRWQNVALFRTRLENASDQYRREISDIYFGARFNYQYHGVSRSFGEVMGAHASQDAYRSLLGIQDSLGIPICLTLNELNQPRELVEDRAVQGEFIRFVGKFYADGVRRCTISHIHLMYLGVLQEHFPDMHWKNTVNNQVRSAQEVIDYSALGFRTVVLDRCLNRDMDELTRIRDVARGRGVSTCLLAHEGCMPSCPFKREHDSWQAKIAQRETTDYWQGIGAESCGRLRMKRKALAPHERVVLPRSTTDLVWIDRADFDAYATVVDVFKFWGRLVSEPESAEDERAACWAFQPSATSSQVRDTLQWAESFQHIYQSNLEPLSAWSPSGVVPAGADPARHKAVAPMKSATRWLSEEGRTLARRLRTCRSQCYRCHACEEFYDIDPFDSLLEWMKSSDSAVPQSHASSSEALIRTLRRRRCCDQG